MGTWGDNAGISICGSPQLAGLCVRGMCIIRSDEIFVECLPWYFVVESWKMKWEY